MTTATVTDWARFMRPVAASVRNPPGEQDFHIRVGMIVSAVNIPAEWLRQPWRQAEAMRRFQFWPAVADIAELFAADLHAERESAERQNRLALPAPPDDRPPHTPEEIEAVRAKARALLAEANRPAPAATPAKSAPVSDGALLAHYRAMAAAGNTAAAVRVAQIEARLSLDA